MKYSRLPSSKPSEASVFQSSRNQKRPRDCEEWQLTGSGPIEGTNCDAPVFTSGLHLRSSPRRSWRVRRATRALAACCLVQNRERSKAHFRVLWASASLQARPFADCAAAPATIPTTPTPRSPSRRLITHFSPPSGRTFRFERWNVQSDAYTRPPPPPPAE